MMTAMCLPFMMHLLPPIQPGSLVVFQIKILRTISCILNHLVPADNEHYNGGTNKLGMLSCLETRQTRHSTIAFNVIDWWTVVSFFAKFLCFMICAGNNEHVYFAASYRGYWNNGTASHCPLESLCFCRKCDSFKATQSPLNTSIIRPLSLHSSYLITIYSFRPSGCNGHIRMSWWPAHRPPTFYWNTRRGSVVGNHTARLRVSPICHEGVLRRSLNFFSLVLSVSSKPRISVPEISAKSGTKDIPEGPDTGREVYLSIILNTIPCKLAYSCVFVFAVYTHSRNLTAVSPTSNIIYLSLCIATI